MALVDYSDGIDISSIKVKGYRLMVKPDPIENVTEGGILLVQDKTMERAAMNRGTVVSIGSLCFTQYSDFDPEPWCKVGDRVLYSRYAGKFVTDPVTGEEYSLMNDEDIIATIEEVQNGQ